MPSRPVTRFEPVRLSLVDLAGEAYCDAVCEARACLADESPKILRAIARDPVDFFPGATQQRLLSLLADVGRPVTSGLAGSARGATTRKFEAGAHLEMAPLSAYGYYRVGEDGRLYLATKSEHYHAPLGHAFPGYRLVEHARRLGVPNATHNNTRGHLTRTLEEELVRTAAGIAPGDRAAVARVIASDSERVLNRVLNLETGSLAVEAALKMILARFYRVQEDAPEPKYRGRTPVFVVLGDDDGALSANYHGTTVLTQVMRGMWPGFLDALERQGILQVRTVRPNRLDDLERVFAEYDEGETKVAGLFHELVMMNYGARRLDPGFVRAAHALCARHDVPTVVDEIQSCLWGPELYLFREYGIEPTFVAVGKGFPGGEYAASRILFNATMDCLPQFGALVTNGQEELASLTYLVTMRWAEANREVTRAVGDDYEARLRELADRHRDQVAGIEGRRHLSGVLFQDVEPAKRFTKALNRAGLDISVQTYKTACPPCALTKLPLVAGYEVVDFVLERMEHALADRDT